MLLTKTAVGTGLVAAGAGLVIGEVLLALAGALFGLYGVSRMTARSRATVEPPPDEDSQASGIPAIEQLADDLKSGRIDHAYITTVEDETDQHGRGWRTFLLRVHYAVLGRNGTKKPD